MWNDSPDQQEQDGGIIAEINVTPLTDIFLVLLIIFMVTSSALTQSGSAVELPRASGAAQDAGLVVTATADRRVELNGAPLTIDQLETALRAAFQKGAQRNVVLRGDRGILLDRAVQIMTIAKSAGAEKIAIATAPEKSAQGN